MLTLDNTPLPHDLIKVEALAASMGAVVSNVDLADPGDVRFAEIERALYHHGLLVFPNQRLSHGDHDRLTRRFGQHGVDAYTEGVPGHPDIQPVIREPGPAAPVFFGANWHTDSPFLPQPPAISILRSVEIPPFGGDTLYASTRQAYASLSRGMRDLLDGLRGLYARSHLLRAIDQWKQDPDLPLDIAPIEVDLRDATAHPLVRTHPATGDKTLYVDENYTLGIEGMKRAEAAPILGYLLSHITKAEHLCRLRWEPDMVAIWDNRLVLHQAFDDFAPHRRELYRSTVLGEIPS